MTCVILPTHRTVVLDAVIPESTGRELLPDDNGAAIDQGLTTSQHTPSRVVQGQRVVDDVIRAHFEEFVCGETHVEESAVWNTNQKKSST